MPSAERLDDVTHVFDCRTHGPFVSVMPPERTCPARGSCPECMKLPPTFNTDIDAGPYGYLGAPIVDCVCRQIADAAAMTATWLREHRWHTTSGPAESRVEPGTFTWSCPCAQAALTQRAPDGDEDGLPCRRASGDVACPACALPYRRHPLSWHRSYDGLPFLHRLCDGSLVKL